MVNGWFAGAGLLAFLYVSICTFCGHIRTAFLCSTLMYISDVYWDLLGKLTSSFSEDPVWLAKHSIASSLIYINLGLTHWIFAALQWVRFEHIPLFNALMLHFCFLFFFPYLLLIQRLKKRCLLTLSQVTSWLSPAMEPSCHVMQCWLVEPASSMRACSQVTGHIFSYQPNILFIFALTCTKYETDHITTMSQPA